MNFSDGNHLTSIRRKFKHYVLQDRKTVYRMALMVIILAAAIVLHVRQENANTVELNKSVRKPRATSERRVEKEERFYVDISGAVNDPGVYAVTDTTRLFKLIEMAGGLRDEADIDAINQAQFLTDGQKIVIPTKGEGSAVTGADGTITTGDKSGLININSADVNELMELNGVGEVIAKRIVEYREKKMFKSVEELKEVNGIGDATYDKLKDQITV